MNSMMVVAFLSECGSGWAISASGLKISIDLHGVNLSALWDGLVDIKTEHVFLMLPNLGRYSKGSHLAYDGI
jgi:hypothetical protein